MTCVADRGGAMGRRAHRAHEGWPLPCPTPPTTGEVVVAWLVGGWVGCWLVARLQLLMLSASGSGQAHAVRRVQPMMWMRERNSPPPTPPQHRFRSGGADVMDALAHRAHARPLWIWRSNSRRRPARAHSDAPSPDSAVGRGAWH